MEARLGQNATNGAVKTRSGLTRQSAGDYPGPSTACPLSQYLKNFEETGDPNRYWGKVIVLNSVTDDARRIDAVMAIREYAKLSLREAKKCFEDCLDGDRPTIALQSAEDAETLARRLTELGLVVSRNAEMR